MASKRRSTRGDGSVYKRSSDGRWIASVALGQSADGKQLRKVFYGKTRKEAADKRRDYVRSGRDAVDRAKAKGATVSSVGEEWLTWLADQGRKRATLAGYASALAHHVLPAPLGAVRIDRVRREHVEQLQESLRRAGASTRTRQAVHVVLNGIFKHALDRDLISRSPMVGLRRPGGARQAQEKPDRVRVWTEDEVRSFLRVARGTVYGRLFEFMLATGVRPGEAYALRWRDVDAKKRTVTIRESLVDVAGEVTFEAPKTDQARRTIPVGPSTLDVLGPRGKAGELVFTNNAGSVHSRSNVRKALARLARKAGVPARTPHELRHTHASVLLARETPIKVVSERLGHRDVTTTLEIYAHLMPGMGAIAVEQIEAVIGEPR